MSTLPRGVLPRQALAQLIADGAICSDLPIDAGQLQPASLDLRLGPYAARIRASFLPGPGGIREGRAAR